MINRGLSQSSAYVFNATTGMLEKVEENVHTIDTLTDSLNTQVKKLDDIAKKVNEELFDEPINNIVVITADDNLIHNYFYDMDVSWDSTNCLSSAIIKMPKMNVENTNYWSTYTGQLTIYAGYNFTFDYVNTNSHSSEKDASSSLTKYWDNSKIKPFFRGEISRVKERENDISIYVDSIGRRFQQKIPDEFRQSFIYNQNVRDAFQAICEFLGVFYICPPKTVTDDGEEESEDEEASTDGTENDVSKQQETAKNIKNTAKNKVNSQKTKNKTKTKTNTKTKNNTSSNTSNNNSTNSSAKPNAEGNEDESSEEDTSLENNTEIEAGPQNGYGDINFDANGAIVHGSTVIETSPDMAETLMAMDEHPLEKYLEDETGIVEYVQKFLNGDMFDEIHNNVMNYDAITIEPKTAPSSDMSAVGGTGSSAEGGDAQSGNGGSGSNSSFGNTSSRAREKNGWIGGQLYSNGKIVLSKNYINTLSPEQARQKRTGAYANHTYTDDTMQKLLWRSLGIHLQ